MLLYPTWNGEGADTRLYRQHRRIGARKLTKLSRRRSKAYQRSLVRKTYSALNLAEPISGVECCYITHTTTRTQGGAGKSIRRSD